MTTLAVPTQSAPQSAPQSQAFALAKETAPTNDLSGNVISDLLVPAAIDWSGRAADGVDQLLQIPKTIGDAVGSLNIPGVSWVSSTVGSIFAGSASVLVQGSTFGAAKWLQGLRRWNAVEGGVRESSGNTEDISSLTARSYLSLISDPQLKGDLTTYFTTHTALKAIQRDGITAGEAPSAQETELRTKLAALEVTLARRSELLELQRLAGITQQSAIDAHAHMERLADQMASKMITKVERYYKDRLGAVGSDVEGSWVSLAARGENGREELRSRIRDRLVSAYEAEDRGESATTTMADIEADLSESFLVKSSLREAGFYAVLGTLMHTGLLSTVLNYSAQHAGEAASWLGETAQSVWTAIAPTWLQEQVAQGLLYAKIAFGGVAGLLTFKAAATINAATKALGLNWAGDGNTAPVHHTTTDVKADASPSDLRVETQVKAMEVKITDAGTDALRSQLDAARVDALGDLQSPKGLNAAGVLNAVHGDAVTAHPDLIRPHLAPSGEIRTQIEHGRIEPSRFSPEVHIK